MMKQVKRGWLGLLLVWAACSAPAAQRGEAAHAMDPTAAAPRVSDGQLPAVARWRQHLAEELMPFWMTPAALGDPAGNFPTFRCNDGAAFRPEAPCPELDGAGWIKAERGRDYTRMKSRQTFVYGVAYHVTGEEKYLMAARAGVTWLRQHAYERDTGSAISYWENGQAMPPRAQRTAQDLAYAQVGLAFYYYLTRDPEVLADLVRLEQYLMKTYWDPSPPPAGGQLRWVLEDGPTPGDARRQELVSQLDQINAYMLLLAPLLEEPALAAAWQRDLLTLAAVVKDRYFAPELGMFWGTLHDPAARKLGGRHVDFGHSMKSLWMLYLTGQLTGDSTLVDFARPLVAPLLARAAQDSGCWASGLRADGKLDAGSQWWVFAELDQAAATLSLREPAEAGRAPAAYVKYLPASYACWFERFVDPKSGDTWPWVPHDWTPTMFAQGGPPKAFHWKNGYHAAEHALVSLITTAGLRGERLPLYYAFATPPAAGRVQPYYFRATIADQRPHPLPGLPELRGQRVEFTQIR